MRKKSLPIIKETIANCNKKIISFLILRKTITNNIIWQ